MKLITAAIAALAVSFAGSTALVQGSNYIVFSAMYSAPVDSKYSIGDDLTGELGMKGGTGFALAFGHKFSNGIVLEAEVSSKSSKAKSNTLDQVWDLGGGNTTPAGTYVLSPQVKFTTTALMVKGVFRTSEVGSGLRPYFGAGLGVSNVKMHNFWVTDEGTDSEHANAAEIHPAMSVPGFRMPGFDRKAFIQQSS